ncbi:MAG TPA: ABC transporter substrate-binding protein, partial [Chitinophagaceae bacterium]|nr:ABC transporter substrate-binding protein [Chitinophagaceae bacterium]
MKRTIYSISFLAGLFFFSLISCREEIKKHRIFRMNQVQNVESLDPAFAKNQYIMWQVYQCYNRLVEFDESMQPVPSLALRWDISSDRTLYTFHLRTDVYFHDNEVFPGGKGRRMTASDVVYSFNRITDEKTASPGAWIFNDRVDSVQPFTALNDSTFQLKLQKPFYPVLGILSMMYCSIVPHEGVEKWGKDFRSHPCGTGPFVFQEWEEAVAITYTRNEHYWEVDSQGKRLPYIDGIKCTQVDSKATEFLMFMQGDLDFMNSIDAVFKDQILNRRGELKPKYRKAFRLQKHPYLNVEYLGFLMNDSLNTQKILLNKKIRQAIN